MSGAAGAKTSPESAHMKKVKLSLFLGNWKKIIYAYRAELLFVIKA
jgi:hypothetical protein